MAHALGARVLLITSVHPGYNRNALAGLDLLEQPAADNPRYANTYDQAGKRTQLLLHPGEPLDDTIQQASLPAADIFMLAPAYHDCAQLPSLEAPTIGISLQGALRTVDDAGHVTPTSDPLAATLPLVHPGAFLFFSDEDAREPAPLAEALAGHGATVLLTRGYRGATLYQGNAVTTYPAIPAAHVADPTGAGDCFATAFIVRYAETGEVEQAMRFGLAAGALAVEGHGLEAIPSRNAIINRLARVAA